MIRHLHAGLRDGSRLRQTVLYRSSCKQRWSCNHRGLVSVPRRATGAPRRHGVSRSGQHGSRRFGPPGRNPWRRESAAGDARRLGAAGVAQWPCAELAPRDGAPPLRIVRISGAALTMSIMFRIWLIMHCNSSTWHGRRVNALQAFHLGSRVPCGRGGW